VSELLKLYRAERRAGRGHRGALDALAARLVVDVDTVGRVLKRAEDDHGAAWHDSPRARQQPPRLEPRPELEPQRDPDRGEAVARYRALRAAGRGHMSSVKRTAWELDAPTSAVRAAVVEAERAGERWGRAERSGREVAA
jgi:hypothetical protein